MYPWKDKKNPYLIYTHSVYNNIELLSWMTNIRFLPPVIQMNLNFIIIYRVKVCIGQFLVNEMYSYICLPIFSVLWHFKKNCTTTVGTITSCVPC